MRSSSSSESQLQYIEHIGGIGHQVKTSFGSQVRRTSLSGGQLSAPSLGVREGAGLLGPQGVKSALRLQASPRAAAERERMGKIKEDQEDEDEDIDELADDASTTSEGGTRKNGSRRSFPLAYSHSCFQDHCCLRRRGEPCGCFRSWTRSTQTGPFALSALAHRRRSRTQTPRARLQGRLEILHSPAHHRHRLHVVFTFVRLCEERRGVQR